MNLLLLRTSELMTVDSDRAHLKTSPSGGHVRVYPTGYTLQKFQKDGCTEVALLSTSARKPSEPSPAPSEPSEPVPSPNDESSTKTKTKSFSTLVTITSCGSSVSYCTAALLTSPTAASETNGAAVVQVGVDLMVAAAAAILF